MLGSAPEEAELRRMEFAADLWAIELRNREALRLGERVFDR